MPLHIGSINDTPTSIFNAIYHGSIERVAPYKHCNHTNLCWIGFLLETQLRIPHDGFALPMAPDDALPIHDGMECAMRRQMTYIYWEIRSRHEWGYNLFHTFTSQ